MTSTCIKSLFGNIISDQFVSERATKSAICTSYFIKGDSGFKMVFSPVLSQAKIKT